MTLSTGAASLHASPKHATNGAVSLSSSQLDLLRASERSLRERLEASRAEVGRKETELQQLRTRLEACESKERDVQHYLALLKESLATKDQQIGMQQVCGVTFTF